jgi:hypothetical protein
MNRDCYHQHKLIERITPQTEPVATRGWVRSVDLACTQWLRERGLIDSSLNGVAPSRHFIDSEAASPLTHSEDVQAD